jgi:hypothetical protein
VLNSILANEPGNITFISKFGYIAFAGRFLIWNNKLAGTSAQLNKALKQSHLIIPIINYENWNTQRILA